MSSRKRKLSDSFFSSNLESIDRYYRRTDAMNQLIEFFFQKHHRKNGSICCHLYEQNSMIVKNSTGPFLANQTKKEEAGPVEFLHFHAYNFVHPIITY